MCQMGQRKCVDILRASPNPLHHTSHGREGISCWRDLSFKMCMKERVGRGRKERRKRKEMDFSLRSLRSLRFQSVRGGEGMRWRALSFMICMKERVGRVDRR